MSNGLEKVITHLSVFLCFLVFAFFNIGQNKLGQNKRVFNSKIKKNDQNSKYGPLTFQITQEQAPLPQQEICNNVVCETNKALDQPAHTRSLIRAFASRLNIP